MDPERREGRDRGGRGEGRGRVCGGVGRGRRGGGGVGRGGEGQQHQGRRRGRARKQAISDEICPTPCPCPWYDYEGGRATSTAKLESFHHRLDHKNLQGGKQVGLLQTTLYCNLSAVLCAVTTHACTVAVALYYCNKKKCIKLPQIQIVSVFFCMHLVKNCVLQL